MKKLLLLFTVILTIQITLAQPPEYFVDTWYLHSFTFNDEVVSISDLGITDGPTLIINNDFTLSGFAFCNNYDGTYEYIDSEPFGVDDNFIPRDIVRATENCGDLEEMEDYFFIPFVEEKVADIYVIGASGNEKHIVLQYDFGYGYQEYKNFPALEIEDISIKKMIIFPNPVKNKLLIQSSINDFNSVSVTDINGRIVISKKNHTSKEIDVSALKSGMYFINFRFSEAVPAGKQGNVTKKFIKK